jgi:hypothetical protein
MKHIRAPRIASHFGRGHYFYFRNKDGKILAFSKSQVERRGLNVNDDLLLDNHSHKNRKFE